MKNIILAAITFLVTFLSIQFLVGATGMGTIFTYGKADGLLLSFSVFLSVLSSIMVIFWISEM